MPDTGLGAFVSNLIEVTLESNRMLFSVRVSPFQWYFTGPMSFSGILRDHDLSVLQNQFSLQRIQA
jgi:hypothetical protein